MKKYICFILALVFPLAFFAQTKSQVTSDITYTMSDFMSDVSCLNEDPEYVMQNIESVSTTFGSPDYFLYNGRQMDSFKAWLESYCNEWLRQGYVEHQLQIKQQTIEKVDAKEEQDKRYRFDGILLRKLQQNPEDRKDLSFVIEWKGEGRYVSLLEIKGNLDTATTKVRQTSVAPATTIEKSYFKQWYYDNRTLALTLIIIAGIVLWFVLIGITNGRYHSIEIGGILTVACIASPFIFEYFYPVDLHYSITSQYQQHVKYDSLRVASVKNNGMWGLIDYKGKTLLPLEYQAIGSFHENMTWIMKDGKVGFIDKDGRVKVEPVYYGARKFHNGQALVYTSKNTGRIIDTQGKTIKELPYTRIHTFKDGLAKVEKEGKVGYIRDLDYQEVIPCIYNSCSAVLYGHVAAKKNGKYGLLDNEGHEVLPFKYAHIFMVGEDRISFQPEGSNKFGMMDLTENIIIPVAYDFISRHSDKLIAVKKQYKYGLMDRNGNWVSTTGLVYDDIFQQADGMSLVRIGRKRGFINEDAVLTIPAIYDFAKSFSGGLAVVKNNDKWGCINKQGRTVIPLQYDGMGDYTEGLMPAKKGKKWGYVNEKNETIISFMYDYAFEFGENTIPGYAKVEKNKLYGVIDKQNQTIIPIEYSSLRYWGNYIVAKRNGKYGILDRKGNPKSAFEFDRVIKADRNVYTVSKDGQAFDIEIK